jgi:hypothetical protein
VTDRSGCGLAELTVLQVVGELSAGRLAADPHPAQLRHQQTTPRPSRGPHRELDPTIAADPASLIPLQDGEVTHPCLQSAPNSTGTVR